MAEMNLLFRVLRALDAGVSCSAEGLAQHLGVPRSKVAAALTEARELGVEIKAERGRGYALPRPMDWLDAQRVARAMASQAQACDVRILDHVVSTNDAILTISDGMAGRVLVVTAELQQGGRGRRGRRWSSGVANALTFTMLWRVHKRLAIVSASSLVVGVGLARAMTELGVAGTTLKWPNDLLCAQGKLGGVLTEGVPEQGAGVLAIGVGINVRVPESVKAAIDQPVADLRDLGVSADRSSILGVCLRHLIEALTQFEAEGFSRLREEWMAHAAYLSQAVVLRHSHGESVDGTLAGIAEDGALLLSTAQGSKKIFSGDVSLRTLETAHERNPT